MKKIWLALIVLGFMVSVCLAGDVDVNGYYKKNGTYVEPYHRSSPNNSLDDNYSTRGNTNPYTGKQGTVDPYSSKSYDPYHSNTYDNNPYNSNHQNRLGY